MPLAYTVAGRDQRWPHVNTWIELQRRTAQIDELFGHWIRSPNAALHVRRWSILDDVLGWGK